MSSTEEKVEFLTRRNPNGFGYEVMKRTTTDKKIKREIVFHTSDRNQADEYSKAANEGKSPMFIPKQDWTPRILKFEEKHGDRLFIVNTIDEFQRACRKIFKERDNQKWYSHFSKNNEPKAPDFKEEDIDNLPESMRAAAKATFKKYKSELQEYKMLLDNIALYEKAKEGDLSATVAFLTECSDGEYERFTFEDPESF